MSEKHSKKQPFPSCYAQTWLCHSILEGNVQTIEKTRQHDITFYDNSASI